MLFQWFSTGLSTGFSGEYLGCLSTLRTQAWHHVSQRMSWTYVRYMAIE